MRSSNCYANFQPIFNYSSFASLTKSSRGNATYDNTTTQKIYSSRYESPDCDALDEHTGNTHADSYYSEDLELVRQLQEKTKSLMDASSRFQENNSNELYLSACDSENRRLFEKQTYNNYR